MMRGIAGPFAREADHLAQHQISLGRVGIIENGAHDAGAAFPHGALAPVFVRGFGGQIQMVFKQRIVVRAQNVDFAVRGQTGDFHGGGTVYVQRGGRYIEAVFPVFLMGFSVPGQANLAVYQQICLFQGPVIPIGFALPQAQQAEIHQHFPVFAVQLRHGGIPEGNLRALTNQFLHGLSPPAFR